MKKLWKYFYNLVILTNYDQSRQTQRFWVSAPKRNFQLCQQRRRKWENILSPSIWAMYCSYSPNIPPSAHIMHARKAASPPPVHWHVIDLIIHLLAFGCPWQKKHELCLKVSPLLVLQDVWNLLLDPLLTPRSDNETLQLGPWLKKTKRENFSLSSSLSLSLSLSLSISRESL